MTRALQAVIVLLALLQTRGEDVRTVCETEACKNAAQRILDYMDPSVKPCDNFYKFACGKFVDQAELHDDKTQNSSFIQVNDRLVTQLKSIVFEKPQEGEPLPFINMKHLFSLCMDESKIDARGVGHAVSKFQEAGGWPVLGGWSEDRWDFLDTEIRLRNLSIGGGSLFGISISVDVKNTKSMVIQLDQASLVLRREFLVKGTKDPIVKAYFSYMVDIAVLYGADRQTAKEKLSKSLLFEIELAKITKSREERRDFDRMYNPYELQKLMADKDLGWVDWPRLLKSMMPEDVPLRENELIIVNEVGFLKDLKDFLSKYPKEVIANYMMWQSASHITEMLTNAMRDRTQEYARILVGRTTREPRWKECIGIAGSLDLALSSLYVKKFFDESSKKEALEMTDKIRKEMANDILEVDWMDKKTRERALHKVSKVVQHIGYPDELMDVSKLEAHYRGMTLDEDHYFEAMLDLSRWDNDYQFRRLREPVNKTDWRTHGGVATVNAFYIPVENSMQFPAGILQQPFFNTDVPKYVNFASIGSIVGHEITHGFDDKGSQFDSQGELKEWREKESKMNFNEKKKCMIDQYGGFRENLTKLKLNGVNTQGENVADNGGLKLVYRAYKKSGYQETALPGLEQYSSDQLFMISMANLWCTRYRPEALKYQILTDDHSPTAFRVNGPLMNMPEFSKIFQCSAGDPMNPEHKCAVW